MAGNAAWRRHFFVVLWKNSVVLRRHAVASVCELLAVPLVLALLAGVWAAFPNVNVPTSDFASGESISPLTVLGARLALRGQRLAVVGDDSRTAPFLDFVSNSYSAFDGACCFNPATFPTLAATRLPALGDVVTTFASESALEAHIENSAYGSPGSLIWAAIVIHRWPGIDSDAKVDVSIRFNASECPKTSGAPVNVLAAGGDWSVIAGYISSTPSFGDNLSLQPPSDPIFALPLPGFLSLQVG
jgi:hypothetical protein